MDLKEVQELLINFNGEIQRLSSSIDLKKITFDGNDPDQKFLEEELISKAFDNILYGSEVISYLNKPVAACGRLNMRNGSVYIDNYKLNDGSVVEIFIDGEWVKEDLYFMKNEYYIGLSPVRDFAERKLQARIRLTEAERLAI